MANLIVRLIGETREFDAKLAESQQKLGAFGQKAEGLGSGLKTALGVAAVAGVAILGKEIFELGDKLEISRGKLETSIKNIGGNFEEFKGKIDSTDKQMENFGFTNADTEEALARLVPVTKDVGRATKDLSVAADLARLKNISLGDATAILAGAEAGRFKALNKLGVQTSDLKGRTDAASVAIQRLADLTHGQAEKYTESFAGKMEVLKAKLQDVGARIGVAVIPVIENLITKISGIFDAVQSANSATDGWLGKLALAGGGLLLTVGAVSRLTTALAALPLVGGGIAALIPPVLAVGAAFGALRLATGYFAIDASDSAAQTKDLSAGLQELGSKGTFSYTVVSRLGENMEKLAKSFRESRKFSGGFVNDLDSFLTHAAGASSAFDEASAPIENTQKALLSLYKTDPKDALAAYEKVKAGLIAQGISSEEVDKRFKKFKETSGALADVLGNQLTPKEQAQAEVSKELQKSFTKLAEAAGPDALKLVKALGLPSSAIDELTKKIGEVNSAAESGFNQAGDSITKFVRDAKVNFKEFADAQFKQLVATSNWATNLSKLADDGLNRGMLKRLADAGPASATLVQSILDNVSKGSVTTLNNLDRANSQALGSLKKHLDTAVVEAETGTGRLSAYINGLKFHPQPVKIDLKVPNVVIKTAGDGTVTARANGYTYLAKGGYAPDGTSVVGEDGPEWLDKAGSRVRITPMKALSARSFASSSGGNSGGGVQVVVNVNNPVGNGDEIARQLTRALEAGTGRQRLQRALGVS